MRTILQLLFTLILCGPDLFAQKVPPLSDSDLAAITARGRMLAAYDAAAWHATDAVRALKPTQGAVQKYIARKTDAVWVVVFGKFNDTKDAFLVAYEATQGSDSTQFTVKTNEPPKDDTGYFFVAAKAIDLALQNSQLEKRPYNTYVLPADSGQLYVYVIPAQTVANVYPFGGDIRFLVSPDGNKIIETRPLHKSIRDVTHSVPSGTKPAFGVHTHVLTDRPEDTDVFHVLRQKPPLPEGVGTRSGMYFVDVDGTIKHQKM